MTYSPQPTHKHPPLSLMTAPPFATKTSPIPIPQEAIPKGPARKTFSVRRYSRSTDDNKMAADTGSMFTLASCAFQSRVNIRAITPSSGERPPPSHTLALVLQKREKNEGGGLDVSILESEQSGREKHKLFSCHKSP